MISSILHGSLRFLAIMVTAIQVASAQSYTWRNVEVGGCGFVTGTVFHPTEAGLVYARTDVGGAYRLDTATQRWIPLNDDVGGINNEFQHLGVQTIGLDANDANRIYIATGQYAGTESWKLPSRIYRSTNRGQTWAYTTPGFKMAGNGEGRGTGERMAVDPLNGANILVGSNDAGIWRSADFGVTWARLLSFPSTLTNLNFLIYAPASAPGPGPNRRVYAAANTLTGQSFWYSDNNGTNWSEVPNHPGKTPGAEMMPLQGSFDAAGVFYATWGNATGPANYASNYGVWKMSATGNTWTSILPPTGQGFFAGISADPQVAGHVVVSTLLRWWPGDEVYRSLDGGSTWTAALRTGTKSLGNSPWATPSPHWMTDIDIDPFNSNRAIFNTGFGLFQTTSLAATGTARTWTFFNDGLEESVPLGLHSPTAGPPLVSVIGDYTGFRHDHLSRSPRGALSPGSGSTNVITGADLAPSKMIRQNSGTTLFSQDAAVTWATFPTTPSPVINGHNRVILSTDGQRLLWCPPNSPAYLSTNNGASWTASSNSLSLTNSNNTHTTTILAGAAGTPGNTNSNGGNARFNGPTAIAIDSSGVRYVADSNNHTIRKIAAAGAVTTLAGAAGIPGNIDAVGGNSRFSSPSGIAVDSAQIAYVADTGNHTIRKITSTGTVTTLAGSAGLSGGTNATGTAARFNAPTGIAVDSAGNVFVCDTGNHTIRKITSAGVVTTLAGSPGTSGTTNANGSNARFNSPQGITLDGSGNLYIADSGNHCVRKVTPAGDVTTFAGLAGSSGSTDATGSVARFNTPKSITLDTSGTIHVADSNNHTIRRITASGIVTTVAGLAGTSGSANGAGTTARFSNPSGIVTTPDGFNLYIADTANHTIRRNTLYNTLTPLADRVDGLRFYLWDNTAKRLLTSTDGGLSFSVVATGMNSAFNQLRTVPGKNGHLWAKAGSSGIYQSTNFGATFTKINAVTEVHQFDFGKAAPSATYPAIFIWGRIGTTTGFFRSDDTGASWVRINDNQHNFGYQNDIAGDPRVYGRLYLATSGRGVVYGDFTSPAAAPSQPSLLVFDDALNSGWTNTSPTGTSLTSTNPVYRGTTAISVSSGSGRGVALTSTARSLRGYAAISFWVNSGATTPPPLQIGVSRGGIALDAIPISVPATVGWQRVVVPFSSIGISNIEDLTGLRVESRTVNSVTPVAFSLDDLTLVGADDFNGGPTNVTVTLSNLTPTYNGSPRAATVTTNPPNIPVLVTYNGSATIPTAAGTYSVSAVVSDPIATGSATGTLVIAKAPASILLTNLIATADGTPKSVTATTTPAGVALALTYNGSATSPTYAGSYTVVATITDPNHQGSASGTFLIRQLALSATGITGWNSNLPGKVTATTTASPLLNPNDNADSFSTNTLHAFFNPITLTNPGDKITLTGSFQLTLAGVSNQGNWFRFGLFDNRGQAPTIITGWSGYTGMGTSLQERITAGSGPFSSGADATPRNPDASPTPISSNSPSGTPSVLFEETITRTATGVVVTYLIKRMDNNTVLMNYTYTDTSPNNNGVLTGANTTANTGYHPTYNTAGFSFGKSYISTTGAQAQFSNIEVSFEPGVTTDSQFISFPTPLDVTAIAAPFALSASASSGLPVSYQIVSGPATVNGNILTVSGVGPVTVRASQAGNLDFLPAADVEQTFNVTKAAATLTLGSLTPDYNGFPRAATATTNPPGKSVDFTYNGDTNPPTAAGSYAVLATINDPIYQGSASGTLIISQAPQTINFGVLPDRTFGDAPFAVSATASSTLPVSFSIVSGPASLVGNTVTLEGAGTISISATQAGDANFLAATEVIQNFTVAKAPATVTLGNLATMFDGQPKSVTATTNPPDKDVTITYAGTTTLPSAVGSYAVVATIDDFNYQGSATGTLIISRRSFTTPVTGWLATNTTTIGADQTSSPLLNSGNGSGTTGASIPFFARFTPRILSTIGDSLQIGGNVTVNTPAGIANQGQWFRFGLFDNPNASGSKTVNNWLGYTAMAQSSAANSLYERIGGTSNGDFASSIFGTAGRTPDASPAYVGANSPSGVVTLRFDQTITRTTTGVTVVSRLARPGTGGGADTVYLSSTFTDTTPNNNGIANGTSQPLPTDPVYSPRYDSVGLVFSGNYINSANTSSAQFANVAVTYTPGADGLSQTIQFPKPEDQPFSAVPINLSATASSGLPVSYTVISGPATVSGSTLTLTGVGEVNVRASQSGDITWLPALPVEQSFIVSKGIAPVILSDLIHTYDGSAKSAIATSSPASLPIDIRYDGEQTAPYQIGTYEVTAMITDDNYDGAASGTLVIEAIPQTITFAPLPDRTFGEAPFLLAATSDSGLPVSFSVTSGPATLDGNTLTLSGAGQVVIRASQPGDGTRAPAPDVNRSFTVAKALATITLGDLTATYDGNSKAVSATTQPQNLLVTVMYNGLSTEPIEPGNYLVNATVVDADHQGTATDTLVILSAHSALENWRFTHFQSYQNAGDAANDADPDHDQISNLMEFALGLNPKLPSTIPATLLVAGGSMYFTYTRLIDALPELNFSVEQSVDLSANNWTTTGVGGESPPSAVDGTRHSVTVTIPMTGTQRFVRLKVTPK